MVDFDPFPQVGMVEVSPARITQRKKHVKFRFPIYSFKAAKAHEILDEFITADLIRVSFGAFPTSEQMQGREYCKFHNVWTHNTASCIKMKDQIQVWINEGKIQFEMAAHVNVVMVEVSQEKKSKRRPTVELVTRKSREEEEPIPKKAKPTPEASAVVLC